MNLKEYIKSKGYKLEEFAEMLDVTRHHLSMCINGKSKMSRKLMKRVMVITKGHVSPDDVCLPKGCCRLCGQMLVSKDLIKKNIEDKSEIS